MRPSAPHRPVALPGESPIRHHRLSRREVLQIAGVAVGVAACGPTGTGESVLLSEPVPQIDESVALAFSDARHHRHRILYLTGDTDPCGDACELDCTASLHDHQYGGTTTWH